MAAVPIQNLNEQPPENHLVVSTLFDNSPFGTWNCGFPTQKNHADKKEAAIKYCIASSMDIVLLQETNYMFENENSSDYKIIAFKKQDWPEIPRRGKAKKNPDRGLAFFIKKSANIEIIAFEQTHPRLAVLEFLTKGVHVVLLNIYGVVADTNDSSQLDAEMFFDHVSNYIRERSRNVHILVIGGGDVNAFPNNASNEKHVPWVGTHVHGTCNSHGSLFVKFLEKSKVYHLNSRFEKAPGKKWTRKRSHDRQGNTEIDCFFAARTDIVQDVDTFDNDYNLSDHRMVISEWRISNEREAYIKKIQNQEKLQKTFNFQTIVTLIKGAETSNFLNKLKIALQRQITYEESITPINVLKTEEDLETKNIQEFIEAVSSHFKVLFEREHLTSEITPTDTSVKPFLLRTTENEVRDEINGLIQDRLHGINKTILQVLKCGKQALIKKMTDYFNYLIGEKITPEDFKTVLFELPERTEVIRYVHEYQFRGYLTLVGCIYSNILARKCYKFLGKYIHRDQWCYDNTSVDVETQRKEICAENVIALNLLIQTQTPINILYFKFSNVFEKVHITSVLKSIRKESVPPNLLETFSNLLINAKAQIPIGNEIVETKKHFGLHLGEVANQLLLNSVIKMALDEMTLDEEDVNQLELDFAKLSTGDHDADKKENADDNRTSGVDFPKYIFFDDTVVLIEENMTKLKTSLESFSKRGKKHGLVIDDNTITLFSTVPDDKVVMFQEKEIQQFDASLYVFTCDSENNMGFTKKDNQLNLRKMATHDVTMCATMPNFIREPDDFKREFFESELIPMLMYNCETWNLREANVTRLQDFFNNLLENIGLENLVFHVKLYILKQKSKFFEKIATRDASILKKLLTLSKALENCAWHHDLVISINEFRKEVYWREDQLTVVTMETLVQFMTEDYTSWNIYAEYLFREV